jgi:hypothetical protein
MSQASLAGQVRSLALVVAALVGVGCGDPSDPRPPNVNFAVQPVDPIATQVVEAEFTAAVTVNSALEIASVTSRVSDITEELVYSAVREQWEARLNLGDIPSPSDQTLEYTATDVAGNVVRAEVPVRLASRS